MKLRFIAVIVLAGGLAGGCATRITSIHTGMTEVAVVETLGKPDDRIVQGRLMELRYERHRVSGWWVRRDDYAVQLSDGKVIGFGPAAQKPS